MSTPPHDPDQTTPPPHDSEFEDVTVRTLEAQGATGPVKMAHPPGLALLFITEMWERFSYYGMRALLTLFMVAEIAGTGHGGVGGGLGFDRAQAGEVYGWYTSLVYLTPVFGGMIADKIIGTHRSMVTGGVFIMLGHIALAVMEIFRDPTGASVPMGQQAAFYSGLVLIIIGTGFFKPCVSVMVGQLYGENDPRRDSGFTIFYMGINLGAFFSAIVCGALASWFGWWAGFGAAAVGMFFGLVVYLIGRPKLLKGIGLPPADRGPAAPVVARILGLMALLGAVVAGYVFAKQHGFGALYLGISGVAAIAGVVWFVSMQEKHERGPTAALFIIAFFVVFFWYAFEQAGSSMNVFAQQRADRAWPWGHKDADGVIESGDLGSVWHGMGTTFAEIKAASGGAPVGHGSAASGGDSDTEAQEAPNPFNVGAGVIALTTRGGTSFTVEVTPQTTVDEFARMLAERSGGVISLRANEDDTGVVLEDSSSGDGLLVTDQRGRAARDLRILSASEFPAAWFQSVNALFILLFAPVFAWLWVRLAKRKMEPSTPVKMSYGLMLLGLGFVFMVLGAKFSDGGNFIPPGSTETQDGAVQLARVSAMYLVFAYLLHTWGELCLSPIGLSLTTKLAPKKWVSFMMGIWFLAPAIAQLIGGYTFAYIEPIEKGEAFEPIIGGQADFFLIFVITSVGAGVVMLLLSPVLKRLIGGRG